MQESRSGRHDVVDPFSALYTELRLEIEAVAKARSGPPDAPTRFPDPAALNAVERRVLVRSLFAFVEGTCFAMKCLAVELDRGVRLTPEERMLAAEMTFELAPSGQVESRRAKLRTLSNINFAFTLVAKTAEVTFSLDASGAGWQTLQRALKMRDRLTHPKSLTDLGVSDAEVRDALRVFIWFESQVALVLAAVVRALGEQTAALKQQVAELRTVVGGRGGAAVSDELPRSRAAVPTEHVANPDESRAVAEAPTDGAGAT